jgi:TonB family protein
MANKVTFEITSPDGKTSESTSDLESIILGSGDSANVKVTDPKVSNLHCMVKVAADGKLVVMDLGSAEGTRVANESVKEKSIASGDVLEIGASKVKVMFKNGNGAEAPKAEAPKAEAKKEEPKSEKKGKDKKNKKDLPRALAGTGKNATALFTEPLPAEAIPTETEKILQVALLWGDTLINVQHFGDGVPVTVGENAAARFNVFSPGLGDLFTIAQGRGSTALVNVPSEAGVVVSTKGDSHKSKEQLKTEGKLKAAEGGVRADAVELGLHDRAQVSFESVAFIVRYVRPSAAISLNTLDEHDFTFFKITSICVMAFIALVAAMVITPLDGGGDGDDIFSDPSKYVKMVVKPEKKQEVKKFDKSGAKEGEKAKEKEGKFGKQDAKQKDADPSKKGAPVVDVNKREEDRKKVSSLMAGMFAGGAASNVFGPGGLGTGINNALGGLQGGAGVGDAQGVGGLGSRGSGAGGGGNGLGLGGLGTKGGGRGAGGSGLDLGGRGREGTRIIPGKTTVVGGLDKDVIMKVIKRHQNEIKFCYEQELQKNPALGGKVAVAWTIDPSGAVSEAAVSESSISNANVESCIVQRIRRWKFPEPDGGGIVNVTFPWIFKAAGDESE